MLNAFNRLKIILLVILVLSFFIFPKQSISLEKNKIPKKTNFRFIIYEKNHFRPSNFIKEYEIDNVKVKVLSISKNKNSFETYFEIYSKRKRVFKSKNSYNIYNIFVFEYNENKYLVITDFSGGTHCCFTSYLFLIDKNENVKLVKRFGEGDNPNALEPISFFIKNNKLYVSWLDPRFQYFENLAFAYSTEAFFERFFLIEKEKVVEVSKDFKDDYIKKALKYEKEIKDIIELATKRDKEKLKEEKYILWQEWFSKLLAKTVNLIMAGEKEKAFREFDKNFEEFYSLFNIYYESQLKEKIKKEIFKKMNK